MRFEEDTRGQSVLIGSILLFGILIIALASYQAAVVPNQNAEVEFTHSQQIENEFSEFHSNVINAIESNDERSTSFTLGTRYPSRLIALNPPAAAGTLSTTEAGTVELDGATVSNVCGGDTSRSLVYEPQYNEYQSAQSTVYEHSLVGTTFRDGQSFPQSQRMIREDGVYLTLLTGNISESRSGSVGVDISATHRSDPAEGVTSVTIPSQFDNETWENQILAGQGNVDRIEDAGDGRIEIILNEPLNVSCAVVGLDSDPEFTPPQPESDPGEPGGGVSPAYDISWNTTAMDLTNEFDCSGGRCKIGTDETGLVSIRTSDQIGGFAEFAIEDAGVGTFNPYSSDFENDILSENIEFTAGTGLGETTAYVFAGGEYDDLTIEVTGFAVEIVGTNSPVTEGETLEVTVEVTNTGAEQSTKSIQLFDFDGTEVDTESVTLDGGDSTTVVLEWNTEGGDAGTDDITVESEDDSDSTDVTVEEGAGAELQGVNVDTSNNVLTFEMENTGTGPITIEGMGIDATNIASGMTIESSTSSNEIEITGSTTDGTARTRSQDVLQADGTRYDFIDAPELNGGQGQYAEIAGGDQVTVDIRTFRPQRLDNGGSNPLVFTDTAADADVTVTFVLDDGTEQSLYLEQS
jgi:Tfp pilus assembly protein PilV